MMKAKSGIIEGELGKLELFAAGHELWLAHDVPSFGEDLAARTRQGDDAIVQDRYLRPPSSASAMLEMQES